MAMNGTPLYEEGYLEKQGMLGKWSWKKYWFVLRGSMLTYYKDSERKESNSGTIDISQAQCVRKAMSCNRGHPIEILTKTKSHVLSADSAYTCQNWIRKLQQGIEHKRRSMSASLINQPSFTETGSDEENPYALPDEEERNSVFYAEADIKPPPTPASPPPANDKPVPSPRQTSTKPTARYPAYEEIPSQDKKDTTVSPDDTYEEPDLVKQQTSFPEPENTYDETSVPDQAPVQKRTEYAYASASFDQTSNDDMSTYAEPEERKGKRGSLSDYEDPPDIPPPSFGDLEAMDFDFPLILNISYPSVPRSEVFDEMKSFLKNNRGASELYTSTRRNEKGGKAIARLADYLKTLDPTGEQTL